MRLAGEPAPLLGHVPRPAASGGGRRGVRQRTGGEGGDAGDHRARGDRPQSRGRGGGDSSRSKRPRGPCLSGLRADLDRGHTRTLPLSSGFHGGTTGTLSRGVRYSRDDGVQRGLQQAVLRSARLRARPARHLDRGARHPEERAAQGASGTGPDPRLEGRQPACDSDPGRGAGPSGGRTTHRREQQPRLPPATCAGIEPRHRGPERRRRAVAGRSGRSGGDLLGKDVRCRHRGFAAGVLGPGGRGFACTPIRLSRNMPSCLRWPGREASWTTRRSASIRT